MGLSRDGTSATQQKVRARVPLRVKALTSVDGLAKSLDPQADLRVFSIGRMAGLQIGDVAAQAGVSVPTIRYYESIGLLARPVRSTSGYRRYTPTTIQELQFIKKAQAFGFSLEEIAEILKLSRAGEAPCDHVLELARRHLAAVDQRIKQLHTFRDQLARAVQKWGKSEAATCDGLCQFIVEAPDTDAGAARVMFEPRQPRRPTAAGHRR